MKILLFGSRGQVGWQLRRSLSVLGEVVALDRHSAPQCGDLARPRDIAEAITTLHPDAVVNAAAYTAVDRAEDDADTAFAINAAACDALAAASNSIGSWLVHYSTDYVYDGSGEQPWKETDTPAPLGVYGRSKLAGDEALARANPRHLILRTCWVFDTWGQNFAKTILRAAHDRDSLNIVSDQWGSPTRAALIADVTAQALRTLLVTPSAESLAGVYHLAASGFTSWHGYALLLLQEARQLGLPLRVRPEAITPVPTSAWPTRARRPANSRLDTSKLRHTFGLNLPPWQDGVRAVVAELAAARTSLEQH